MAALSCFVVLIVYVIMWFASPKHEVPVEIKTLVGLAGGAWFQGITTDKRKRERDVQATATRAEHKADDALSRSDSSLERETEWSKHRDHTAHDEDEGG